MHRLTNTLLAILLATLALLSAPLASAQQTTQPWPTRGWATSSPEEQGLSSERLARLVEFGARNDMDSVLVTRHGRIVLEATYAPFRAGLRHHIYSATKSVTSTLVGVALGEGLLDGTDRRVVDLFAGRTIANLDDAKKAITVQHLLDMTSGLAWQEGLSGASESYIAMVRSPDWQQFILDHPMAAAPGTRFFYSSGNSHAEFVYQGTRSNTMNGEISSMLNRTTLPSTTLAARRSWLSRSRQTNGANSTQCLGTPLSPRKGRTGSPFGLRLMRVCENRSSAARKS